jgi:uncharacterized membrane protein
MEDLSRSPTKIERLLASLLSAVATLIFGGLAVFIFRSVPVSHPAFAIFTALSLISGAMFVVLPSRRGGAFQVKRRLIWLWCWLLVVSHVRLWLCFLAQARTAYYSWAQASLVSRTGLRVFEVPRNDA